MFESIGKPKCAKKSVTLRIDQIRWLCRLAGERSVDFAGSQYEKCLQVRSLGGSIGMGTQSPRV